MKELLITYTESSGLNYEIVKLCRELIRSVSRFNKINYHNGLGPLILALGPASCRETDPTESIGFSE